MAPDSVSRPSTSLHKKLSELSGVQSECTIYRVHHVLRNVNPKAYEPEVIAIGPYHHDKDHLKRMEEQKLRFLQQLLDDNNNPYIVVMLVKALGKSEEEARRCYADQPKTLTSDELDFIHRCWIPPHNVSSSGSYGERFINNASRLEEANVKFGISTEKPLFDIGFEEGVIMMAPLTIDDGTESFLRNLIAYEQYFQHNAVTDYVRFLDCIIDSSKDVEILSRRGVIKNWLGDENNVAEMVNKLRDGVCCPHKFEYEDMFKDVKKHCKKRRNKWMAKLRHNYFNSPCYCCSGAATSYSHANSVWHITSCLKDVGSQLSLSSSNQNADDTDRELEITADVYLL